MERRGFIFVVDSGVLFDEEIPDPHQALKVPILTREMSNQCPKGLVRRGRLI